MKRSRMITVGEGEDYSRKTKNSMGALQSTRRCSQDGPLDGCPLYPVAIIHSPIREGYEFLKVPSDGPRTTGFCVCQYGRGEGALFVIDWLHFYCKTLPKIRWVENNIKLDF